MVKYEDWLWTLSYPGDTTITRSLLPLADSLAWRRLWLDKVLVRDSCKTKAKKQKKNDNYPLQGKWIISIKSNHVKSSQILSRKGETLHFFNKPSPWKTTKLQQRQVMKGNTPLGSKGSELLAGLCNIIHLLINKTSHWRQFITKLNINYRKSFKLMLELTCCFPWPVLPELNTASLYHCQVHLSVLLITTKKTIKTNIIAHNLSVAVAIQTLSN